MAGGQYKGRYNELSKLSKARSCNGFIIFHFFCMCNVSSWQPKWENQAMTCLLRHAGQKRGLYFTAGWESDRLTTGLRCNLLLFWYLMWCIQIIQSAKCVCQNGSVEVALFVFGMHCRASGVIQFLSLDCTMTLDTVSQVPIWPVELDESLNHALIVWHKENVEQDVETVVNNMVYDDGTARP